MPIVGSVEHLAGDERKKNWCYFFAGEYATENLNASSGSTDYMQPVVQKKPLIVFFPGDISSFHDPHSEFPVQYNLESLFWVLLSKYPGCPVLMVKPKMMEGPFSIFINFLLADGQGNP